MVVTPDGHRFQGTLVERRVDFHGRDVCVLRLDSGWVTTYPAEMVRLVSEPGDISS